MLLITHFPQQQSAKLLVHFPRVHAARQGARWQLGAVYGSGQCRVVDMVQCMVVDSVW